MTAKQAGQLAQGLLLIALSALLLDFVIILLGRTVPHLAPLFGDVVVVLTLLLDLVLTVILFFAIPQALVLWRVQVQGRWPYFLVGAISAAMFMAHNVVFAHLNDAAAHTPSVWFALGASASALANVRGIAGDFAAIARSADLYWLMLIDAAISGFAWHGLLYRLPGDTQRDWQDRILGANPPYGS